MAITSIEDTAYNMLSWDTSCSVSEIHLVGLPLYDNALAFYGYVHTVFSVLLKRLALEQALFAWPKPGNETLQAHPLWLVLRFLSLECLKMTLGGFIPKAVLLAKPGLTYEGKRVGGVMLEQLSLSIGTQYRYTQVFKALHIYQF